jgi:hypothetical protein
MRKLQILFALCFLAVGAQAQTLADTTRFSVLDGAKAWHTTGALLKTYIGAGVGGSGTTGYLPKFSASSTLTNSKAFETSNTFSVGTNTGIDIYSRFYIYGGASGANLDVRGSPGASTDQAVLDLQGSDYATEFKSMLFRYSGVDAVGTVEGIARANMAEIQFGLPSNILIRSIGTIPMRFYVNASENFRISTTGAETRTGKTLRIYDSDNTHYVELQPPATGNLTTSYALTLPVDDGTPSQLLQTDGSGVLSWVTGGGGGTVTSVSVATANGFAGTVANATTTPAITLTTSITGVLKGNGTAISAATAGTDYSLGTSALATGIVKSTTSTGALTIAIAGDFPTLNQSTTGSAATLTTTRGIYGNNFNGSAALTQIIASGFGGTGNGFTKFSGATSSEKTYTLPNASTTILTTSAAVTIAQGGTGLTALGTALQQLRVNAGATALEYFTPAAGGTVTSVSVTTANGVSGSVATATTTPAITLTLGAITPTSVNSVVLSGSATPTLSVSGTTTVSGTNSGDQTSVTGNSGTATALQTARTINGTSFNGTANITVTAAAGTLTGATLAAGVTASSLTSVGTIATGVWNGTTIAVSFGGSGAATLTGYLKGNGTSAFTASATVPFSDVTGTVPLNRGGTGQITKAPAFDALSPMTTAGDIITGGASGTGTRLAMGTALQQPRVNAGGTALEYFTPAAGGDMLLGTAQTNTGAKTFATGTLISPDLTGGAAVGSNITYKSTTGAGTAAGIAHQFTGGTNGATVAMTVLNNGSVGIGTTSPNASTAIDIVSTTRGLGLPSMTNTQMNAIASPRQGVSVYNSTILGQCVYDGTKWYRTSQAQTATIAANAGAGTAPTISISGTDLEGIVTLTVGTTPIASTSLFTVTFGTAFGTAPKGVVFMGYDQNALALPAQRMIFVSSVGTTTFVAATTSILGIVGGTQYKWSYRVIQ